MNIVMSNGRYEVYGDNVQTFKTLPVRSYELYIQQSMEGIRISLLDRPDLIVNEDKVYGDVDTRTDKIMRSFNLAERNFGVILSGPKGTGKSILARVLAQKAIAAGLPVIVASQSAPGVARFLASIEQEVMIIFDEFDKTFAPTEDFDPQEELLPLFDGLNAGKKLFVITCNDPDELNEFLLNRPGRFHYHFTVGSPSDTEIREYMQDKLLPQYHNSIDEIVNFAQIVNITYDYLRAIAFELNQGYPFQEVLQDLNISRTTDVWFDIQVTLSNGEVYACYGEYIDLYRSRPENIRAWDASYRHNIIIKLAGKDIHAENGVLTIDPSAVTLVIPWDMYGDDNLSDPEEKALLEKAKEFEITDVQIVKRNRSFVPRYAV